MSEFLTPAEFAELLRVHPATVREQCAAGKIPGAHRIGAHWRIDLVAFRAATAPQKTAAHQRPRLARGSLARLADAG